ncbi:MAG: hypothetical protein OSJ71_08435 [Acetatifactor sp.]|nr:hypothetical protein [Acetatifactor sp.]
MRPLICVSDYVCKSVVDCLIKVRAEISFYKIDESLLPSAEIWELIDQSDAVLVVNYFGLVDIDSLTVGIRKKNKKVRIIVDDVMNFYGAAQYKEYDYSFTNFRKWFPVPDGAEIRCSHKEASIVRLEAETPFYRYKMAGNILKNYRDFIGDDICLELIKKGEELLDMEYMASCSSFTESFMDAEDITDAANRRRSNGWILHKGLEQLGI